jgi:hypothetical protein
VLVKWKGYARPTWEPLSALADTAALASYEAIHGPVLPPTEAVVSFQGGGG